MIIIAVPNDGAEDTGIEFDYYLDQIVDYSPNGWFFVNLLNNEKFTILGWAAYGFLIFFIYLIINFLCQIFSKNYVEPAPDGNAAEKEEDEEKEEYLAMKPEYEKTKLGSVADASQL